MPFALYDFYIWKSQSENEIYQLFEAYEKELNDQKSNLLDQLTDWQNKLINYVQTHARKQERLIQENYENERRFLKERRQQFISELHVHEKTKNTENINQLLDVCRSLQFKFAALNKVQETIPYVQVTREKSDKVRSNGLETRNRGLLYNSSVSDTHEPEYNRNMASSSPRQIK